MNKIIATLILFFGQAGFAGESDIQGVGRVTAPADFVQLSVHVTAECFPTAKEAVSRVNAMSQEIYSILQEAVGDSESDGVFTSGGWAQPFSRTISVPNSNQREEVCINTFKATNTITLKSTNVESFAADFARIQDQVYSSEYTKPGIFKRNESLLYATLGQPQSQWFASTRAMLQREAGQEAIADAQRTMSAYAAQLCIEEWDAIQTSEANTGNVPYGARSMDQEMAAPVVNFDQDWISKSVTIKFEWEGQANERCQVSTTLR